MTRFQRILIATIACIVVCGLAISVVLQSNWGRQRVKEMVESMVVRGGATLTLGSLEGSFPLVWTAKDVHLELPNHDTLSVDVITVRLSLFHLMRGRLGLDACHAHRVVFSYGTPQTPPSNPAPLHMPGSYIIQDCLIDEAVVINRISQEQGSYRIQGMGEWLYGGSRVAATLAISSTGLDLSCKLRGNRKLDLVEIEGKMHAHQPNALGPFSYFPARQYLLELHAEGSYRTFAQLIAPSAETPLSAPIIGALECRLEESELPYFVAPQTAHLRSQFSLLGDRSLSLSHVWLEGTSFQLEGAIALSGDGAPTHADLQVSSLDLHAMIPELQGIASGSVTLAHGICTARSITPTLSLGTVGWNHVMTSITLQQHHDTHTWEGDLQVEGDHPSLGCHGSAHIAWTPFETFHIPHFEVQSPLGKGEGVVAYTQGAFTGSLALQIDTLEPLSLASPLPLHGQVGITLSVLDDELNGTIIGKGFRIGEIECEQAHIQLSHFKDLKGDILASLGGARFRKLSLNSLLLKSGWNMNSWDYQVDMEGSWETPLACTSRGSLTVGPELRVHCHSLEGTLLNKTVSLRDPFEGIWSPTTVACSPLHLTLGEGYLQLKSAQFQHDMMNLQAEGTHIPLHFLTLFSERLSLEGLVSLDVDLLRRDDDMTGSCTVVLERADIYPRGATEAISTKGSLQLHCGNHVLQVHADLKASQQQLCEVSATLPFTISESRFQLLDDLPFTGQCTVEGHLEQLLDFVNLGPQRIGGFLSCQLLVSGTLAHPHIQGPILLQKAFYENYFIGISVKEAMVSAQALGTTIAVERVNATDGEMGVAEATATFYLKPHLPFSVQGTITHFRILRFDWLTGSCSGPFSINGNLEQALAKGELHLDTAHVSIPDKLPSDIPSLPISWVHAPPPYAVPPPRSEPYPFYYELEIEGSDHLELEGRGVEAELEGNVSLAGKNLSVAAQGTLHTKKGKITFGGQTLTIAKGELVFSSNAGFLNMTSHLDLPQAHITLHFRGALTSPELVFESTPPLPTSSIVSLIVFGKDVPELSAPQAVQLASMLVTLSQGSKPSLMESIRRNLGVDRLSFSSSEDTGSVAIEVGKYLTQGVMVTLIQSTDNSRVRVEVELKAGFLLEAETQENNQGKFSFKWHKNY